MVRPIVGPPPDWKPVILPEPKRYSVDAAKNEYVGEIIRVAENLRRSGHYLGAALLDDYARLLTDVVPAE